jgi:hypothetical protein
MPDVQKMAIIMSLLRREGSEGARWVCCRCSALVIPPRVCGEVNALTAGVASTVPALSSRAAVAGLAEGQIPVRRACAHDVRRVESRVATGSLVAAYRSVAFRAAVLVDHECPEQGGFSRFCTSLTSRIAARSRSDPS